MSSRKIYHEVYYALNKDTIIKRAIKRYRDNNEQLKKAAREKYKPKKQRHLIYR